VIWEKDDYWCEIDKTREVDYIKECRDFEPGDPEKIREMFERAKKRSYCKERD